MRTFMLVSLAFFLVHAAQGATIYKLTDLGTLGGTSSYGTAINDNGTAVGYSLLPNGDTHAFRWTSDGGMVDLNPTGGTSFAYDVNNQENIVGRSGNQAYRWATDSGLVLIDTANNGSGNGLNENSEIVGERNVTIASSRTLYWDSGNTALVKFPLFNTSGVAINNAGEFVGINSGGVDGYFSDGTNRTITNLLPADLNDSRQIVGSLGGIAALLDYDTNNTTLLGKLSLSDTISRALGINEAGTIVGVSEGTGAFIYDSSMGSLGNLTSMLSSDYVGWTILAAEDINNLGHIVGVGRFNGVDHAVVLTAIVPEPMAVLLMAGACLVRWRFRYSMRS